MAISPINAVCDEIIEKYKEFEKGLDDITDDSNWEKSWRTRKEIAEELGISIETVRGKVQKGQIERIKEDGKYYYRVI